MTILVASLAASGLKSSVLHKQSEATDDEISEDGSAVLSFLDTIAEDGFYDKAEVLFTSMPIYFKYVFAVNIAIFIAWRFFPDFMERHALFSRKNMKKRRFHTILTNNFSQESFAHLYGNMFFFVQVMQGLKDDFSDRALWTATIIGSLTSTLIPYYIDSLKLWWLSIKCSWFQCNKSKSDAEVERGIMEGGSLGFSGINCLLLYLLFWRHPNSQFQFFNERISTRKVIQLTCESDIIGALGNLCFFLSNTPLHSPIGHEAHLSGVFGGILFRLMLEHSVEVRRELDFGDQKRVPVLHRVGHFLNSLLKDDKEEKVYGELFPQISWDDE